MSIKSILVPLDGSDDSFQVLDTAHIVAQRFDARIKAIHVSADPEDDLPYMINAISAKLKSTVIEEAKRKNRENVDFIRSRFVDFCKSKKITISEPAAAGDGAVWHEETGHTIDVLVKHARLADVVVTLRPQPSASRLRRSPIGENLEAIMLRAGRPLLLVPPGWAPHKVQHAAVAWNESLEATRALAMTLPWLAQMKRVSVIVSRKREMGVSDLLDYLSLHGVKAETQYLPEKSKSVAAGILDTCTQNGVELLVVGGFSQARARQLIFGGVTSHLLSKSNLLTVMVH